MHPYRYAKIVAPVVRWWQRVVRLFQDGFMQRMLFVEILGVLFSVLVLYWAVVRIAGENQRHWQHACPPSHTIERIERIAAVVRPPLPYSIADSEHAAIEGSRRRFPLAREIHASCERQHHWTEDPVDVCETSVTVRNGDTIFYTLICRGSRGCVELNWPENQGDP